MVRICGLGTTCGTTAEIRTEYDYWGNTALPSAERRIDAATGVTRTIQYSYDAAGRLLSVDGPRPGNGDATYFRYDILGRRTWEISTAGTGGVRVAKRISYRDADDKVTLVETGTLPDAASSALMVTSRVDTSYDSRRNSIRTATSSGSTIYGLTNQSFDDRGQLVCQTVRMNKASNFAAAPADACQLGAQGSDGPDWITRNEYDLVGRPLKVIKAYGQTAANGLEPLQQDYVTYSYSWNGKQTSVKDANGNLAGYTYDGFDRLTRWSFPDKVATGSVSATDYESYSYDAVGNRLSLRKRDGQVIGYSYDNLNRVTLKDAPGTANDVYYGYDVNGLQLYARFGSAAGAGLTQTYDGFGQLRNSSNTLGGTALTLGYQYDVSGNRIRVTHPDGVYFAYEYDDSSRQTAVRENGGTVVATIAYDAQGRRSGDTRGGVASSYGYDPVSRPVSLTDNLAGTADDVTTGFSYNAASQIIRKERSNNAYAFTGYVDIDRSYGINGLNQYTSSGPASLGYDNNGNLTSDGAGNSFGYDVENRLVSKNSALLLAYDPNGRLWQTSGGTTGTTRYLYDGDELVAEYGPTGAVLKRYVHGAGADDPILWYEGAGLSDRRSLQIDSQGSIVSVADAAGNKIAINAYDEYGIPNGFDVGIRNLGRFQYTGQIWLPDLGMYYYKARIYSPSLGRFLQTDPIGYKDQVNLYAYVGNDPVNGRDPTGNYNCGKADCPNVVRYEVQLRGYVSSLKGDPNRTKQESNELKKGEALLKFLGTKNDNNGVNISGSSDLGPTKGGDTSIGADGSINIRLNFSLINERERNGTAIGGAILAHEAAHGYEYKYQGEIQSYDDRLRRERNSYRIQFAFERRFGIYDSRSVNEAAAQSCSSAMDSDVASGGPSQPGHCR